MQNGDMNRFFRRYGGYICGVIFAAVIVTLAIIGSKHSSSDILTRYSKEKFMKQVEEASSAQDSTDVYDFESGDFYQDDEVYDKFFGVDELSLYYKAHIAGLDGEMFIYDAQFDVTVSDATVRELDEAITRKCGQPSDDNRYGEIFITKKTDSSIEIVLDLGNAYEDKAITGIFKALNELNGVRSVTVNGGLGDSSKGSVGT